MTPADRRRTALLVVAGFLALALPGCLGWFLAGGCGIAVGVFVGAWAVACVPVLMFLYAMSLDSR